MRQAIQCWAVVVGDGGIRRVVPARERWWVGREVLEEGGRRCLQWVV